MRTQLTNLEVVELSTNLKKIYLEVGLSDSLQVKLLTIEIENINQWLLWIAIIEKTSSAKIANEAYQWLLEKSKSEPKERKVLGFTEEQEKKYKHLAPQIQEIEIIKKITDDFNKCYIEAILNNLGTGFDAELISGLEKTFGDTVTYLENNDNEVNIDPAEVQKFREMKEFLNDAAAQEFLKKGTIKCEEESKELLVNSMNSLESSLSSLRDTLAQHGFFRDTNSIPSTLSSNENNNEMSMMKF